jgi:hypothetical protein
MRNSDGTFGRGNPGKPMGAVSKTTKTVKETVMNVFNNLQDDAEHNLEAFAKKYPKEFYQIAAKLIPTEISGQLQNTVIRFKDAE